ncbi:MAG: 2-amino-4-hydroxy-6-hydroxymethyldihydropteridine diphosphokinase [Muribaculaceae bacterium]|nr:2-amino-4-hydroxy-6-hydroxymethyldihydropteridine diphosphokinase [Muribaculaceae bacterium]MDE7393671.1 2-amino-4-hydroxy-6-hydroxymethyldihydropteridine diphosphokinase [Muribaculaceae bacterium]
MKETIYKVAIMIGTNVADRDAKLKAAREAVAELLAGVAVSPVIDSPDFTGKGADYLNQVVTGRLATVEAIDTAAESLIGKLHAIEDSLGRDRSKKEIVDADIDLVMIVAGEVGEWSNAVVTAPREASTTLFKSLLRAVK